MKNVTWAVLKNGEATITAQVMDIGIGGISIHSSTRLRISKNFSCLDLVVSRNGNYIENIPSQAVSSANLPSQIPFGPPKWRYGLKFGKLTQEQHAQIDGFISKHAIRHDNGPVTA